MTRLLVCGGRDFANPAKLWRALDAIERDAGDRISIVMDGASDDVTGPYVGADYWGNQWALARNKPVARFHADWKTYGKSAGPRRNAQMLEEGEPTLVVAFSGGNGTANMMRLARTAGVRVIEIAP